jgi:hypothetical protein
MKKKQPSVGFRYYQQAGYTKSVVIHLTPELYESLKTLSDSDERSIQITARRILEEHLGKQK